MFTNGIFRIFVIYTFLRLYLIFNLEFKPFIEGLILYPGRLKNNNNIEWKRNLGLINRGYTSNNLYTFVNSGVNGLYSRNRQLFSTKYDFEGSDNNCVLDIEESQTYNNELDRNSDLEEWNDNRIVDVCKIQVEGGDGGDGCVSFRREKHVPLGGANGGNGGPGGDVYIQCSRVVSDLRSLDPCKKYKANDGSNGKGSNRNGAKGKDLYLYVPPGTVIFGEDEEEYANLIKSGDKIRIARGGRGGKGNRHYVTRENSAPKICEKGEEGTSRSVKLIYKRPSDIALIGKPNSGKSSIIKFLTNARPRVASYPFSTRFPIHGVMELKEIDKKPVNYNFDEYDQEYDEAYDSYDEEYVDEPFYEKDWGFEPDPEYDEEYDSDEDNLKRSEDKYVTQDENGIKPNQIVLVDIPGLIDGSSRGRGLGHDFLRHIERCEVVSYVIDSSLEDPVNDYLDVRNELEQYDSDLLKKKEILLLNKIDLINNDRIMELIESFSRVCNHDRVFFLSAKTGENMEFVTELFSQLHSEIPPKLNPKKRVNIKIEDDEFRELDPRKFMVQKDSFGVFRVLSPYLERKIKMMRFDLPETLDKLKNFLKVHKVNKKLIKLGLKDGDILNIGEMSFRITSEDFLV